MLIDRLTFCDLYALGMHCSGQLLEIDELAFANAGRESASANSGQQPKLTRSERLSGLCVLDCAGRLGWFRALWLEDLIREEAISKGIAEIESINCLWSWHCGHCAASSQPLRSLSAVALQLRFAIFTQSSP